MERRLAAILAADVVGYSRMMGVDEVDTLNALKAHRSEVIDPTIAERGGRIVKTMGDGLLVEFGSVVDAVQCATDLQRAMAERNAGVSDERRIDFRIGINLGDVIIEDGDIYGDGVNVAARLEGLAEPGGICISRAARDQIRDKLPVVLEDLGEQSVKNIARPVRVFRIKPAALPVASAASEAALPDKPSIAVLPFNNMSGDPEQEYFSDGITEDIITELSRFRSLFVIARNSSFAYKGQAVKIQDVGKDLGVRYVLEGSVRKAGNRVRITGQLIDAQNGSHVWAQRYDRELEDIFAVQDDVTQAIVAALPQKLEAADLERAKRKTTENMVAYDYLLRGKEHHHRGTNEDNTEGIRCLEQAIELDPGLAHAHAWLGCILGQAIVRGYLETTDDLWRRVKTAVETARALDENDSECHRLSCEIHLIERNHDQAEVHQDRALSLNPNDPRLVIQRAELLSLLGRPEEALEWVDTVARLDPNHADGYAWQRGVALQGAGRYAEAVAAFKRVGTRRPWLKAHLAACYAELGDDDASKGHGAELLEENPDFTVSGYLANLYYKNEADANACRDSLLKAGLPA